MQLLQPKQAITAAVALAAVGVGMLANGSVSAKSFEPNDIGNQSYVIGEYLFTRETNSDAGYEGYINTRMIMLAAKTIQGNTLDDMDIYYKKADGSWVDGLTNEPIADMPDNFNIEFKNLDPYVPKVEFNISVEEKHKKPIEQYGYTTIQYTIGVSNEEEFDLNSEDRQPKADGIEFLALADDIEDWVITYKEKEPFIWQKSLDCQIKIDDIRYCNLPASTGSGIKGVILGIGTPLPINRTYNLLIRAYKNVGDRVVYSEPRTLELTTPTFRKVQMSEFPGTNSTGFIPNGQTLEIGVADRYGYIFDGYYVGRDCTSSERAAFGIGEGELCLCPTETPYDMGAPITSDVKIAAKWIAKVYSIKVMPTDAVGAIMGTAKVFVDGVEMSDKYTALTTDDDIQLFDSENPSIALSELNSITNLKLVITYSVIEDDQPVEKTFTTTANVTQVPYSN